jgi:hypothetical protein
LGLKLQVYFMIITSNTHASIYLNFIFATILILLTRVSSSCPTLTSLTFAIGGDEKLQANCKMSYSSLIRKLYRINMSNPVKMGLQNSEQLYNLFGRPLDKVPIVHVAGTNGKGSVTIKAAECLKQGGFRTGLFVSPHISSFRERIQIDGVALDESAVKVSFFSSYSRWYKGTSYFVSHLSTNHRQLHPKALIPLTNCRSTCLRYSISVRCILSPQRFSSSRQS